MISVRRVLVERNISAKSRAMLLYMIDLSAQQFRSPTGVLKEFYMSEIEESTIADLQRPILSFNESDSNAILPTNTHIAANINAENITQVNYEF